MPSSAGLEKLNLLLLELAKSTEIDSGDFDRAIRLVTDVAVRALDVERASVWLYNAEKDAIVCRDLFVRSTQAHSSGVELRARDFPRYFAYLAEQRTLPAHDAMTDPCTSEFAEVYLRPLGIVSMLDAPIRVQGATFGVFCNEHVGEPRTWSKEEQLIAGALADVVARAQIASDRAAALQKLNEHNRELESVIRAKTEEVRALHADRMEQLAMMLRVLCHDLATPISVVRITVDKLVTALEPGDSGSAIGKGVEAIRRSIEKVEQISGRAKQVLKASAESGSLESREELPRSNLGTVLKESLESLASRLEEKGIQVEVMKDGSLDRLNVIADALDLETDILNNILSNAIKFSYPGDRIQVSHERRNGEIRLTIRDHGIGIPRELIAQFEANGTMASRPGTRQEQGTGFGMELIRKHMKKYKGRVEIASESPGASITLVFVPAPAD